MEFKTYEEAWERFDKMKVLVPKKSDLVKTETSSKTEAFFETYYQKDCCFMPLTYGIEKRVYQTTHKDCGGEDWICYVAFVFIDNEWIEL